MMKILHIITRIANGGSEQRLIDALRSVPAATTVVVSGDLTGIGRLDGLPNAPTVIHEPTLRREVHIPNDLKCFNQIRRIIRDEIPDIIHTHQAKAGLIGRLANLSFSIPLVHSYSMASHGPGYAVFQNLIFRSVEKRTAFAVDRYVTVGEDLRRRQISLGIRPDHIEVVRSAIQLSDHLARNSRLTAVDDPNACHILYVGSLDGRKGVLSLAPFACQVREELGRPVHLRIAGDGPLKGQLDRLASDVPDGVTMELLGYRTDIPELMGSADLAVLLSSAEGLPQFLVQAAASGLPFASYHVDGTTELLNMGATGVIAPIGDVSGLAAQVANLLSTETRLCADNIFTSWEQSTVLEQYRNIYISMFSESA